MFNGYYIAWYIILENAMLLRKEYLRPSGSLNVEKEE